MHPKGEKTVSININGASSLLKLAVSVSLDGTKLLLFVIFKRTPVGSEGKSLPSISPPGIVAFVQPKAWMDYKNYGNLV